MNRHAFAVAVAFVLCALIFGAASAQTVGCPSAVQGLSAGDNDAANRRLYERYWATVRGNSSSLSENFILDEKTFGAVQGVFDGYVRARIARVGLQRFDDLDVTVAGSEWSLEHWLTYLLQHGTQLGRNMAALSAGVSNEDDMKMIKTYKEDELRLAESFWGITGQQMVDHARAYYNISVSQLTPTLLRTDYGTYRGYYYNPNFLNIKIFLDQALRNYQICSGSSAGR